MWRCWGTPMHLLCSRLRRLFCQSLDGLIIWIIWWIIWGDYLSLPTVGGGEEMCAINRLHHHENYSDPCPLPSLGLLPGVQTESCGRVLVSSDLPTLTLALLAMGRWLSKRSASSHPVSHVTYTRVPCVTYRKIQMNFNNKGKLGI